MTDRIELRGLKVHGYHGCLGFEHRGGQDLICDVALWLDLSGAAASDELDDTVNYANTVVTAHGILTGIPHDLIETVMTETVRAVLADNDARAEYGLSPLLHAVEMTTHEPRTPIPLDLDDAAVTIRRPRKKRLV